MHFLSLLPSGEFLGVHRLSERCLYFNNELPQVVSICDLSKFKCIHAGVINHDF